MTLRVLFVDHTAEVSGAERSLLDLLAGLPEEVEPVVACPEGPFARRAEALEVPVIPVPEVAGSFRLGPVSSTRAVAALARLGAHVARHARRLRADVVHANSVRAGLGAVAAKRPGAPPVIVHVRDVLPAGLAPRLVRATISHGADVLVAVSRHVAQTLGDSRGTASRVIYNGVDLDRFAPDPGVRDAVRRRLGYAADDPIAAMVGQITPWKGQRDAIDAVSRLRSSLENVRLLIVGEAKFLNAASRYDHDAYRRSLEDQVSREGLGANVSFLGERDDVSELLRAADLALVPSWEEPFGRSVVEAMAAAIPVIATSIGGPAELVDDGVQGVLLPPRRPELWSDAMARLLQDRAERERMGRAGRRRAELSFGRDRHVAEIVDLYEEVRSTRRSR